METKHELTADEIRELDERANDVFGIDQALSTAVNFAANRRSQLRKEEARWWKRLMAVRGLKDGPNTEAPHGWIVDRTGGSVVIRPVTKDEHEQRILGRSWTNIMAREDE